MRTAGHAFDLLSMIEVERLYQAALRILAEMGLEVQNQELLEAAAQHGLNVDLSAQRIRFPRPIVEAFLAAAPHTDWETPQGQVGGSAGVYHGYFHDPQSGDLLPWTEERLAYYFALASSLPNLSGASMLGCQIPVPPALEALYERYYCWKYGASEGSSILVDEISPYLLEFYEVRAAQLGKPIQEIFRGTVYLVPPFKLGIHEASQVAFFRRHGLQVGIGDMYAMGANSPVTLAGSVALNLAEQLALRIVDWAWFGVRRLTLGGSIAPLDMKTMIYPYGRPEQAITNLMTAQLARFLGAEFHGHAGLSDAKLPSVEVGYQKALTAIPTLMAGGSFWMDAGLLSTDEIFSPIQMILDNEFLGALKRFTHHFEVSDETLALDDIFAAGPGGSFIASEHTARHFRDELWQPRLWSREMASSWLAGRRQLDADQAREQALAMQTAFKPTSQLDENDEMALLEVIKHAKQGLNI